MTGRRPGIMLAYSDYTFARESGRHTTNMRPNSLTVVHFRVCCSCLNGGLLAAEVSSAIPAPGNVRSSIKTFVMRLLMMEGLVGANDLDHRTTPDVVRISNESNILKCADMNPVNDDSVTRTFPSNIKLK